MDSLKHHYEPGAEIFLLFTKYNEHILVGNQSSPQWDSFNEN